LHCCVCVQLRRLGRTPHSSFAKKALIISSGIKPLLRAEATEGVLPRPAGFVDHELEEVD